MMQNLSHYFSTLAVIAVVLCGQVALAGTVEVIAIRHGESLNNILSQNWAPVGFAWSWYQQSEARSATKSTFTNPVLSTEGKNQALALHDVLFPSGADKANLLNKPKGGLFFYTSPLNRTIQTTLLVFQDELFKTGVKVNVNPYITEHRKSVSEDGFEDAKGPIELFKKELSQFLDESKVEKPDLQQLKKWKRYFKDSFKSCCDKKKWWPQEKVETAQSLNKRIGEFKKLLATLPDDSRVIVVSHGTFLRTLFFGIDELKQKQYHIRNLGMLIGTFDKETGNWAGGKNSVACWDPAEQKAAPKESKKICLDHLTPEGVVVEKAPTYAKGSVMPTLGTWTQRRVKLYKVETKMGISWAENSPGGQIRGAAMVQEVKKDCTFHSAYEKGYRTLCLEVKRVKHNKTLEPQWDQPYYDYDYREIFRIVWKDSDAETTEYFRGLLDST